VKIGAILPHLQCFGGVRRFLELGNVFVDRGIDYTIFARKSHTCDWFDFKGKVMDCSKIKADYVIVSYPPDFSVLGRVEGKVFVYVIVGGKYIEPYNRIYGTYPFIINNRVFKKWYPKAHLVEGGVNTEFFKPSTIFEIRDITKPKKVLYYNKDSKGGDYIKSQLADLDTIELVGFQGLNNNNLLKMYQSGDFFVSWESREGWSNPSAEALACGLTVVTNGFNCQPFIDKVIVTTDLRKFFMDSNNLVAQKRYYSMEQFSWEKVADKLLELFAQRHKEQKKNYHTEWTK